MRPVEAGDPTLRLHCGFRPRSRSRTSPFQLEPMATDGAMSGWCIRLIVELI
jgi:hypothetical protein